MSKSISFTRRQFLRGTGACVAAFAAMPGSVLRSSGQGSANEKLNIAGIGIGGQGGADIDAMAGEGQNIVALCDVDDNYAAKKFQQYSKAKRFKDYRVMLDSMGKEINAVVIGTPDHTHAIVALEAMKHGKPVYCEKPLAHNYQEVEALMAAAHKYKVVTQLGNQGHSSGSIRRVCEWIWTGAIGKVHTVHAGCDAFKEVYNQRRNFDKISQHFEVPKTLDYDLWVGPAQFRPYTPFWVPWNWRRWMPFGTGVIGDWFCHVIDPSFWALDLGAPVNVLAEPKDYDPKKEELLYPVATRLTYNFPAKGDRGPVKLVWHDGDERIPRPTEGFAKDDEVPGIGAIMFGDKGMLMHGSHGGGGCRLLPEKVMEERSGKNAPPEKIVRVKNHAADFIQAIKTGRQAGSNFDYGGPLTQAALLGAIAIRFPGQTLEWDAKAKQFTNNKEANGYLNPPYREGWKLA